MGSISRSTFVAGTAALIAAPRFAAAQTRVKVRFCGVPTDDLSPVFWAIQNGDYEKAGLAVEFVPTASGTAATTAVIAGAYELGKGSLIAGCAAHLKHVPITFIGNGVLWETNNPWSLGVVASDSTCKTGADLNGQVVSAAALNDLAALAINAWVDKTGGDSKTLKFVEIPNSAEGPAVAEHRVAACQLNEPQLQAALDTGKVKVLAPFLGAIASSYVLTNYFARPDWARAHRSVVEQFVHTTYEVAAFTNTHPADTAPMIAKLTKIPLDVIQKMTRAHTATSSDPALIQPPIDVAAKYGQIAHAFPAKDIYFNA
jgi:NitT/TauT family transport system substrate-binding protein